MRLFGKGFRSAKNKQAALAQKLQRAKSQNSQLPNDDPTPQEEDEEDAHAEFAKLLAKSQPLQQSSSGKTGGGVSAPSRSMGKATKRKSKKRMAQGKSLSSKRQNEEPIQEEEDDDKLLQPGDKARRKDFEPLIDVTTATPLGPLRAAELVPWVPPFLTHYLIVLADPRRQSTDLRQSIEYLSSQATMMGGSSKFLAICSDDSPKTLQDTKDFLICLDPSLDWMTTYGCTNQYSLHLLVLDNDGILQSRVDSVLPSEVCQQVANILKEDKQEEQVS